MLPLVVVAHQERKLPLLQERNHGLKLLESELTVSSTKKLQVLLRQQSFLVSVTALHGTRIRAYSRLLKRSCKCFGLLRRYRFVVNVIVRETLALGRHVPTVQDRVVVLINSRVGLVRHDDKLPFPHISRHRASVEKRDLLLTQRLYGSQPLRMNVRNLVLNRRRST